MLRFSNNYKNFISRGESQGEALAEHLDVLKPAGALYHKFYEQARSDKKHPDRYSGAAVIYKRCDCDAGSG